MNKEVISAFLEMRDYLFELMDEERAKNKRVASDYTDMERGIINYIEKKSGCNYSK